MQIAVGGCLAQKDRGLIVEQGALGRRRVRHPQPRLAAGAARTRPGRAGVTGRAARGAGDVPVDAAGPPRVGVPRLGDRSASAATTPARSASCRRCAGKEKDRRPGDILAEIEALVADGVLEVTLLGQNVNSYGVEFGDRAAFGKLLRACGDDRRPGARPLHLAAPARLHRRRDRRDGRDAERHAEPAHAAAVGQRPACSRRCAAPTAPRSTSASSTGCGPRCPTPRSPPTSSSASPGRPRRTSPATLDVVARRPASPARSPSSTRHGPVRRPRRCPTRCRPRSSRSATRRLVDVVEETAWAEGKALRRCGRRGAGRPKARAARTARPGGCPAGLATTGWCTWLRDVEARPGDIVTASGDATPRRTTWSRTRYWRFVGPVAATPGRRDETARPRGPASCSACPPWALHRPDDGGVTNRVVAVVGPTATGKSALGIALAQGGRR